MRLIDADALIDKTDDRYSLGEIGRRERDDIVDALEFAPTIERKTGEWIEVEVFPDSYDIYGNKTWSSEMQCNQCGFRHTAIEGHMAQYRYCPNCGTQMGENYER